MRTTQKRIVEAKGEIAIDLYRKTPSLRKAGEELGITSESVRRTLIRNNIPRRRMGRPEIYPKTDFSGDAAELARIIGFIEDCGVGQNGKQIHVQTGTTHFAQMKLFDDIFGRYGNVSRTPVYNRKLLLYQWQLQILLNQSFEFLPQYKKEPVTVLAKIAEDGYENARIASMIDAEGYVGIEFNHGYPLAVLSIGNNNRQVLEWTQKPIGGGIGNHNDGYELRLYGKRAVGALRKQPIAHEEKVAAKELILHYADNGGIGLEALRAYEELRRRIDEEVRLCPLQSRLEYIGRHTDRILTTLTRQYQSSNPLLLLFPFYIVLIYIETGRSCCAMSLQAVAAPGLSLVFLQIIVLAILVVALGVFFVYQKISAKKIRKAKLIAPTATALAEQGQVSRTETAPEGIKFKAIQEPLPEEAVIFDRRLVHEPYGYVVVAKPAEDSGFKYYIVEPQLKEIEAKAFDKISDVIETEFNPKSFEKEEDLRRAVFDEIDRLIKKYGKAFKALKSESLRKIRYYVERNFLGFGHIDCIMRDPNIEDLSCDGINSPVFIWHRRYESMPTNLVFLDREALDDFVVGLAHKSGKHISTAFPIVDAMLAGKHRLASTFREEVSPKGSTFTIRKFREEPLSIIDLIETGTLSPDLAAYFWLLLEHKMTVMVIGSTAAGKTTFLNTLASMAKPATKIVTVEETAEVNIPLENWVRLVSRETYALEGEGVGSISLFDLVKTSLRYRPDYLIVGEVRGEEAYVLFQALATGHGGLSTMHADTVDAAIKRLTSPPMNIAPSYIPFMNSVAIVERVTLAKPKFGLKFGRRVRNIWEVIDAENSVQVAEWVPETDSYIVSFQNSYHLKDLATRTGRPLPEALAEIEKRRAVLQWLSQKGIRKMNDVAKVFASYYANPAEVLQQVYLEAAPVEGLSKEDLQRRLIKTINVNGGQASFVVLQRETGLDDASFWDLVNELAEKGEIIVAPGGICKLKEVA